MVGRIAAILSRYRQGAR